MHALTPLLLRSLAIAQDSRGAPLAVISSVPRGGPGDAEMHDKGAQSQGSTEPWVLLPGPILCRSQLTQHPCPFLRQQCPGCKDVIQKPGHRDSCILLPSLK